MKKNFKSFMFLAFSWLLCMPAEARKEHLLPLPKEVTEKAGVNLQLNEGAVVSVTGIAGNPTLERFFKEFGAGQVTFSESGQGGTVHVNLVQHIQGTVDHNVPLYPNEAYKLEVNGSDIQITAVTETGVTRAAQTLTQLAEGYDQPGLHLEGVSIVDWPSFKVRGFMHDVGRSFITIDELKNQIDLLSRFKVNVFHWHMTEKLAWRFEVKKYPQLTDPQYQVRYANQYYTQQECRDLVDYAAERGVLVVPEIDMPGHSDVFTAAMGFEMQDVRGVAALKDILDEVCDVFEKVPYIHIGGDEVNIWRWGFLEDMANHVRSHGKKVVMWNRLVAGPPSAAQCDMTQMWASAGHVVPGLPNIDCRYNYTNHFDVYADLVGIYKSNIYYTKEGTDDVAGTISAAWNDTKTRTQEDIVRQNNIYANIIASAERAWKGGGEQYIETGGTTLPNAGPEYNEFADFERRFLFHKDHSLKNEPIAYVKQSNVRWRITDPFPNGGRNDIELPPEQNTDKILPESFSYLGQTYQTHLATGAGIYLRHIWHGAVPSFFDNPGNNQTAYAWTYVYSKEAREVGAQIEFYTYSRSGNEYAPAPGEWDRRGSKVWLNDELIPAPQWEQTNQNIYQDDADYGLTNENLTARDVVPLKLKAGWNKVFMRLPHVDNGGTKRDKWQFTFVLTEPDGKHAAEGLIYSPDQSLDEAASSVIARLGEIKAHRNSLVKDQPGYYPVETAAELDAVIEKIEATLGTQMSKEERAQQLKDLDAALQAFDKACESATLAQPKLSKGTTEYYYTMNTPLREGRYATSYGAGNAMVGELTATDNAQWKFVLREDGAYDIVNKDGTYVSPDSPFNSALRTQSTSPSAGWTLGEADAVGYFIITSGTVQFNQTNNNTLRYQVYNWGSGTEKSDTGCKYAIQAVQSGEPEPEVDPALPEVGKKYYFVNKFQGGDQYFYANGQSIGFSTMKMDKNKAYVWECLDGGNGCYNFKNLDNGQYFAWKTLSADPCAWRLNSTVSDVNVMNPGCVTLQAIHHEGSNFLVSMRNGFDQANRGGFYTEKYSSDYYFELCTNEDWEGGDQPVKPAGFYCDNYGENWVRLLWNTDQADVAGVIVPTDGDYNNAGSHAYVCDLTAESHIWCLVGNENGFYLQNAAAGKDYALNVNGTWDGVAAHMTSVDNACQWVLVKQGNAYAICPKNNTSMSLNSYGGQHFDLKLYDATDPGSLWQIQPNLVKAMQIGVTINGENPYNDPKALAGELNLSVNGTFMTAALPADSKAELTYYLPADSRVAVSQNEAYRGFIAEGLEVNGLTGEQIDVTIGKELTKVQALYRGSLDNGIVLYRSPGPDGHPYRIPAIAQAKNGHIFAISDFRPCGKDIGFGEVDIMCRISEDGGKHWGDMFCIADGIGDAAGWNDVWKTGFGDAAVVADAENNEILVMSVCGKTVCWDGNYPSNPNRVARIRATYNEETKKWDWTGPEEATEDIYSIFTQDGNRNNAIRSLFIGSGRICQSHQVKVGKYYRLYCAVWNLEGAWGRDKGNRVIYSDDFGATWNVLGSLDERPAPGGDEPKCEELPNGNIILSSRATGRIFNIFNFSDLNRAEGSWGSPVTSDAWNNGVATEGTPTNGEILLLPAIRQDNGEKVTLALQSLPCGTGRTKVGIYFKEMTPELYSNPELLAADWTKGLQVSPRSSAYSTMILQQDGHIGFYFEEAPGEYSIVYLPLSVEKITNDQYRLDPNSPQTGIGKIVITDNEKPVYYDLSGRRVAEPAHGVYIKNGHKVVIK